METRRVIDIIWRKDLYPRIDPDSATTQEYVDNLEKLPPIEINQHNELIDGYHRWTAHRKAEAETIEVTVTPTINEAEFVRFAIERNSTHGLRMSDNDKKEKVQLLYNPDAKSKELGSKEDMASLFSVSDKTIARYVKSIDDANKKRKERIIREMWLACRTEEEIADEVGLTQKTINQKAKDLYLLDNWEKGINLHAQYIDEYWKPQLYDIWNFEKNDNKVKHPGNTHVSIVDNLLYTFTQPFDIIIDPFGGGGSTIDICKKRLRRYWVSDRKPIIERLDIREHDLIISGISGPYHWGEVALVYLDPPYWKQSAGKYSNDPTDLANMTLENFTRSLIDVIQSYGDKLRTGAHIACIISPTQWPNEDKSVNYHDIDLACGVNGKLRLVRRAVCPYSTQQYNGTQYDIAEANKLWMVLSRTLLVWEVV